MVGISGGNCGSCSFFFVFLIKLGGKRIKACITRTQRRKKEAYNLIKKWYVYVERHQNNADQNELNHFESEVDAFFKQDRNRNLTLAFDRKFRRSFLKEMGIKKELLDSPELFLKYSRLDKENVPLVLKLHESSSHRPVTFKRFPFQVYWHLMMANFRIYYGQSQRGWEGESEDKKRFWGDIEMPFRIIRRQFKD